MPMPAVAWPSHLRLVVANHSSEISDGYAMVPMRTGAPRRRRVQLAGPEIRAVEGLFSHSQVRSLHDWFENDLIAGERPFSIWLPGPGPGLVQYEARFLEPYTAEPIPSRPPALWRFAARLLLQTIDDA